MSEREYKIQIIFISLIASKIFDRLIISPHTPPPLPSLSDRQQALWKMSLELQPLTQIEETWGGGRDFVWEWNFEHKFSSHFN